jgi:hypothetical protein
MASLLEDSLTFLSSQLEASNNDVQASVRNIKDRAFRLLEYSQQPSSSCDFAESPQVSTSVDVSNAPEIRNDFASRPDTCVGAVNTAESPVRPVVNSLPPIPVFPGVDQDSLRNLLMSWFYVGYYTAKSETST